MLKFIYGTMASGKSLHLLSTAHNLKENHIRYQLLKPSIDTRTEGTIRSRIGIEHICTRIHKDEQIYGLIDPSVTWLLIDESQFLTESQVNQLAILADKHKLNIICYGLRTDYLTRLFEGSKRLFEIADEVTELPSYCECGTKTSVNARINSNGEIETSTEGSQIEIGGDERYKAICRECFFDKVLGIENSKIDEQ